MEHVKVIERTLIHEGTVVNYYQDRMLLTNGNEETWDYVEHKSNAAAIVPVTKEGKILLVNQYRPAAGRFTWEIPAGKKDPGEDGMSCAVREFKEETGYEAREYKKLFTYMGLIAYCSERVEVFKACDVEKTGEQHLDPSEDINIREFELSELMDMIREGKIEDGKTIAALLAVASDL